MRRFRAVFFSIIESSIRNISGGFGQRIRYLYYSKRFKSCGKNVKIDEGVLIQNPENMEIGNNVWLLAYSVITARGVGYKLGDRVVKQIDNPSFSDPIGSLVIEDEVSIGTYNIIQAFGGLRIKKRTTTSARVSIYTYSHYPIDESRPSVITYANSMVNSEDISCIESPVVIEEAVWLGLNVIVFGGTIGKYSFVSTNSVVIKSLPENSYAAGSPAIKLKNRFQFDE